MQSFDNSEFPNLESEQIQRTNAESLVKSLHKLAVGWEDRGDRAAAEVIYRLIMKMDKRLSGIRCDELTLSYFNLAEILCEDGRHVESEHLYLQALSKCSESVGDTHPTFAMILRGYATLLDRMNLKDEACNIESRAAELLSRAFTDSGRMTSRAS